MGECAPTGPRPRYNRALDANSFYDDFMTFAENTEEIDFQLTKF